MYVQFVEKAPVHDGYGKPILTYTDSSNPWWVLLKDAIEKAGGKLHEPEILAASTDSRYFRRGQRFPAFGFSPMVNTPILLHDHNEVYLFSSFIFCLFLIQSSYLCYVDYSFFYILHDIYVCCWIACLNFPLVFYSF